MAKPRADLTHLPELWSATDVREYSGYSRQWTGTLLNHYRFPRPAYEFTRSRVWLADEVRAFLRDHQDLAEDPEGEE